MIWHESKRISIKMILVTYFKLIRWKNLLLIVYVFLSFKLFLFDSLKINSKLSAIQFIVLLLSVLFITAAGNIYNDISDIKADAINKPKKIIVSKIISIETAKQWYKITNAIGLILGIIVCLSIENPTYSFIFIAISILLYYYSKRLKHLPVIGNIVVSFLITISVLILPFFDIDFSSQSSNQNTVVVIIAMLSFFAFSLNLIREIIKDVEDINGDYYLNMRTLPILIGSARTQKLVSFLCLIPISFLIFIIVNFSTNYKLIILYLLIFTLLPLIYVAFKLNSNNKKTELNNLCNLLKLIMFFGISSMLIFSRLY